MQLPHPNYYGDFEHHWPFIAESVTYKIAFYIPDINQHGFISKSNFNYASHIDFNLINEHNDKCQPVVIDGELEMSIIITTALSYEYCRNYK